MEIQKCNFMRPWFTYYRLDIHKTRILWGCRIFDFLTLADVPCRSTTSLLKTVNNLPPTNNTLQYLRGTLLVSRLKLAQTDEFHKNEIIYTILF